MKKINFSKDNIKKKGFRIYSFIKKHTLNYFKEFPLFTYFIFTALFNTLLLRFLTVGNFYYLKPLFFDLGMLLILSSFVFLFRAEKKRNKYLVVLSFFTTINI